MTMQIHTDKFTTQQCHQIGHDCFLVDPSEFIIHSHPPIKESKKQTRRNGIRLQKNLPKIRYNIKGWEQFQIMVHSRATLN
jgi:hypothetical protein